ncbi:hypothetical protein CVT24_012290 [Panaeolus cyanescens]|uniref:Uncharacterized protein n=1 Tax=Panaeolus cyanescens TaxID=181874 RepID=A0A409YJ41_9AGAR|nr:hypothetical protein CVT24_012290 [Panaeolus cyanescens]
MAPRGSAKSAPAKVASPSKSTAKKKSGKALPLEEPAEIEVEEQTSRKRVRSDSPPWGSISQADDDEEDAIEDEDALSAVPRPKKRMLPRGGDKTPDPPASQSLNRDEEIRLLKERLQELAGKIGPPTTPQSSPKKSSMKAGAASSASGPPPSPQKKVKTTTTAPPSSPVTTKKATKGQGVKLATATPDESEIPADTTPARTIFTTSTNKTIPASETPLNMDILREIVTPEFYEILVCAQEFRNAGPFYNFSTFEVDKFALDTKNKLVRAFDDTPVVGIMFGAVNSCELVSGISYTTTYSPDAPTYSKRITITPTSIAMHALRYCIRKVFKQARMRVPFLTETEVVFATTKNPTNPGVQSPVKPKTRRFYGTASKATSTPQENLNGRPWYDNPFTQKSFADDIPIYDATQAGFAFDEEAFANLKSLPRYPHNLPNENLDAPTESIVAVAFTSSMYGAPSNPAAADVFVPLLTLNVQFVVVLGELPPESEEAENGDVVDEEECEEE